MLMFTAAGLLAALTATGRMNSYGVLALTFVLGCGTALMSPAWQAIQPELVPKDQIPAAAALGGVNMNLARAIGPALGGLVVALAGTAAVFAINAVSFLVTLGALAAWRRRTEPDPVGPERILRPESGRPLCAPRAQGSPGAGPVTAVRSLRRGPVGPATCGRAAATGMEAGGYGLLLGAVGVGAAGGRAAAASARPLVEQYGTGRRRNAFCGHPGTAGVVRIPGSPGWSWCSPGSPGWGFSPF